MVILARRARARATTEIIVVDNIATGEKIQPINRRARERLFSLYESGDVELLLGMSKQKPSVNTTLEGNIILRDQGVVGTSVPSPPLVSYQVVPPETGLDSGGSTSSVYSTYGYATLSDSPTSEVAVYGTNIDHQGLQQTTFVYVPQQGETHTIYSYEATKDDEEIVQSPGIYHSSPTVITASDNTTYALLHTQPSNAYVQRATVSSNRSRHYIVTSSGNIGVSTAASQQQLPVSATQTQTFLIRPANNHAPTSTQPQSQVVYNRSYVYKPVVTGTPQPSLVIPASSVAASVSTSTAKSVSSSTTQGSSSSSSNSTTTRSNSNYTHYVPPRPSSHKSSSSKSKSQKKDPIDQKGVDEEVARNVSQILNASMNLNHRLSSSSSTSSSRSYSSTSSSGGSGSNTKKQQSQQPQQPQQPPKPQQLPPSQSRVCRDCNKTVSSSRNLSRHRQSCKVALQKMMATANVKPAAVSAPVMPATDQNKQRSPLSSQQGIPQSAPPTDQPMEQSKFEGENLVAECVGYMNVSMPTSVSISDCSQQLAYVQSVSSTDSLSQTHTYVPVVVKEQQIGASHQPQLYGVRTSEVQLENGQQATIIYDQYAIADPNSYNLSDGPHCDEQLLNNAVADLSSNPLTLIDSNDLSGLEPVTQAPTASMPATASTQNTFVTSSSVSTSKGKPPSAVYQCESCSKVVCSARSLKRHRSTCKKYLEQFGHLLEDPQVKLNAIGNCSVRTSTTNVCEACSRQLCSSSNLKRHRATCKAFLTSGENANGQEATVTATADEERPAQSVSVKSDADEHKVQPSAATYNPCSSSTDPSVTAYGSTPEKPWITVGEHLRAQHSQLKQREMQKVSSGRTGGVDFNEVSARILELQNEQQRQAALENRKVESSTTPLASNVVTELRSSTAYGGNQQKPIQHAKLMSPQGKAKPAASVQVVSTTTSSTPAKKSKPKDDLRYECPECSKTFSYSCRKNVKRHRMAVHKLTPEQIQKSDPVRVVVVSKVNSSSITTYSHVGSNGTPKAIVKIQPTAITTVVPLPDDHMIEPTSSNELASVWLPDLPASNTVESPNDPVSSLGDFRNRDNHVATSSLGLQNLTSRCGSINTKIMQFDIGYTMPVGDRGYNKVENTTCAELAEADTTFSEELDELAVQSLSPQKPQSASTTVDCGSSPSPIVTVASVPTVTPGPGRIPSQSLPPSPRVAVPAPVSAQSAIATPSLSPCAPEAKRPKPAHVCEACNKSLSSEYSLRRHKSTCQAYKVMMEQNTSSALKEDEVNNPQAGVNDTELQPSDAVSKETSISQSNETESDGDTKSTQSVPVAIDSALSLESSSVAETDPDTYTSSHVNSACDLLTSMSLTDPNNSDSSNESFISLVDPDSSFSSDDSGASSEPEATFTCFVPPPSSEELAIFVDSDASSERTVVLGPCLDDSDVSSENTQYEPTQKYLDLHAKGLYTYTPNEDEAPLPEGQAILSAEEIVQPPISLMCEEILLDEPIQERAILLERSYGQSYLNYDADESLTPVTGSLSEPSFDSGSGRSLNYDADDSSLTPVTGSLSEPSFDSGSGRSLNYDADDSSLTPVSGSLSGPKLEDLDSMENAECSLSSLIAVAETLLESQDALLRRKRRRRYRSSSDSLDSEDESSDDDDKKSLLKRPKVETTDEDDPCDSDDSDIHDTSFSSEQDNNSVVSLSHDPDTDPPRPTMQGDILLYVGNGKWYYELPKKYLSDNSKHFGRLFDQNPDDTSFILPADITSSAFEKALGVMTKQAELDAANVEVVLHVGYRLKFIRLFKRCRHFIKRKLANRNLMLALCLSDEYGLTTLKKKLICSAPESALKVFNQSDEYTRMSTGLKAELLEQWATYL